MPPSQTRQDNLNAIQRAEEASVILGIVSGHVNTAVSGIVSNLVSHYRGGKIEHDTLLGGIAEISAMMAMVDHLRTTQLMGEKAAEREFKNGTSTPQPETTEEKRASVGTRGAEFRRSQPT